MPRITSEQVDDLVLQLKGLVLVRQIRAERGAEHEELAMYGAEIDHVRKRLASLVGLGNL
jgi:hypothetical protein